MAREEIGNRPQSGPAFPTVDRNGHVGSLNIQCIPSVAAVKNTELHLE